MTNPGGRPPPPYLLFIIGHFSFVISRNYRLCRDPVSNDQGPCARESESVFLNAVMRAVLTGLRIEFKPMLALAGPVVMAEIGWMTMGIVDIMMVGRLGAEAIGAVSIGHVVFLAVAIFGVGLLLGLDTEISQAFGGRRMEDCNRWFFHGVFLSLA